MEVVLYYSRLSSRRMARHGSRLVVLTVLGYSDTRKLGEVEILVDAIVGSHT